MSTYLSNLLTQTTSRYNSFRRTLLSSEDDGDTEDDTHICRVLRAYYTERSRQFPAWLPPDPNDRRAITPQPYANASASSGYFPNVGGRNQYAGSQGQQGGAAAAGARSSLSDLWDAPRTANAPVQPQSLRNARRPPGGGAGNPPSGGNAGLAPPSGPRPLPSQRAGSYQSVSSQQGGMDGPIAGGGGGGGSSGGGTAQDRLKARLWGGGGGGAGAGAGGGGRATSPAPGASGGRGAPNQYDRPTMNSSNSGGDGNRRYGR